MTWEDWQTLHANLSAMTSPRDMTMLADWCVLFRAEGFVPDELAEASRWVAVNNPPIYRSEHIRRLTERVRSRQKELQEASRPDDEDRGTCDLCGGCGVVSVPGAGIKTAGKNRIPKNSLATVAVLCSCALGHWMGQQQKEFALLSLAEYTRQKPNWRDEARRIEKLRAMRVQAHREAANMDRKSSEPDPFDLVIERVRKRVQEARRRGLFQ